MMVNQGIDYFGRQHFFSKIQDRSTLKIRHDMYDFLKSVVGDVKGLIFLDHGSTPDTHRLASNCFLHWLVQDEAKVYTTSPENIDHLAQNIPGVTVLNWPLDLEVLSSRPEYTLSSAVIEHVGSERSQIQYVESLLDISPCLFITTPNRFHWLEFHTKIPFLHWLPRSLHRKILKMLGMNFWADENNLNLISKSEFEKIILAAAENIGANVNLTWYTPRFLGMISNLCVIVKKASACP